MSIRTITTYLLAMIAIPSIASTNIAGLQPVQIYAYTLEHRLNEAGTMHYNKLLNIMSDRGLKFNILIRSLARSARSMKNDQSACLFPTTINAIAISDPGVDEKKFISSDPIDRVSLRIFTRPDNPKVGDIKELSGKRVALWNGLDPKIFLANIEANIETTPNEAIRVKMLNAGRIDAILGFTPDVLLAAESLGFSPPHYDESLALFRNEGASLVCHDNKQNREFILRFNKHLTRLKASGELREILGKHADIVN